MCSADTAEGLAEDVVALRLDFCRYNSYAETVVADLAGAAAGAGRGAGAAGGVGGVAGADDTLGAMTTSMEAKS